MRTPHFENSPAQPSAEALVPQEVPEVQGPEVPGPGSRITVIICDDHPAYAKGLALLLEHEAPDFKVLGVALGATEAVGMTKALYPDVVLMDIRMPVTDGIEATRLVKGASKDTKVIMLTVSDEPGDLNEAMRAGASGFVTKDKEPAEIAEAVQQVIRGHLVIPADLAARFLKDLNDADISSSLTEIEQEILTGFVQGKTNKQIAQGFEVSERTVCRRIDDLYQKLHLTDRIQAAIWAVQHGYTTPNPNGTRKPGRPRAVPRKPGRPLKVRNQNRPPKSLVPTPTQTQPPITEETIT